MADVVSSLTAEIRIVGRIIRETLMGLKRTGWMNVIIVITMASILSIFGVVMALIIELSVQVKNTGSELEISAYVANEADYQSVSEKLKKMPHVKLLKIKTKELAWEEMRKEYALPEIENPLPDTIHIQMTDERYIQEMVDKLRNDPEIESVQYAKSVLDKIRKITQGASVVGVVVSFFLGALTLFIISNTIHLLIQAKAKEIEILRMMGVGNWYIRLPFLMQGGLYGLLGALISYLPLYAAVFYLNQFFAFLGFQTNDIVTNYVLFLLVLMGILVSSGGAAIAIRKYLHT